MIPNVDRIKIEKHLFARDIEALKKNSTSEQREELPTLTIDYDEPVDARDLKEMNAVSYYYENIFSVEDFYLYRGIFYFYSKNYERAI